MEDINMTTMTAEETPEEKTAEELQKKTLSEELLEVVEEAAEREERKAYDRPSFWKDNRGVGVIEIVLILVILIGLVLVFKEQITGIVNDAFTAISGDAGQIIN